MTIRAIYLLLAVGGVAGLASEYGCSRPTVLHAAQVPASATVLFDPPANAAADGVSEYRVQLDSEASILIPASSCAPGCSVPISIQAFGPHTVTVWARNLKIDPSEPPVVQEGSPASVSFRLNPAPTASPRNVRVR